MNTSDQQNPVAEKASIPRKAAAEENEAMEQQVAQLRTALRTIGGCCNDTDCLGAM